MMHKMLVASFAASLLIAGCSTSGSEPAEPEVPQEETPSKTAPDESKTLSDREPTKEVTFSVEGEETAVTMELAEGSDSRYSLYIDPERYQFEKGDKEDLLTPIISPPDDYPEVNMSFIYVENQTPENVKEDMKQEYSLPLEEKTVSSPVHGLALHGTSGAESDSEVVTMYLIEAGDGTLLITEKYFLEAQEGHGARFEQMLETLEVQN
ncbi:hypothetical protein [Sporosarcina sp. P33]|uniref:hypothetical protein n=1 Tax=Sporosarcina sp. P33 TaxID=1930764 RepID=UPI0012DC4B73|nr:hypothetical protein [Sporosarcina sp. P33]